MVGCDSSGSGSGSNEDSDPPTNIFGTFRFEGNQGFNPDPSDYDLYYEADEEGTSLHTCRINANGNWELIVEEEKVQSVREESDGNLVKTSIVTKAEGEIYDGENEGNRTQIRYTTIEEDFLEWTVTDSTEQQDLIGNQDDAKRVDEIPQTASECSEKLRFNVDDADIQKLEDNFIGMSRIVESGGNDGTTDNYDVYVNGKRETVDLHVCNTDDQHFKDTKARHHLRTNSSGNLVITEKITDVNPDGGVHGEEDLGRFTTTEILSDNSNSVEWKLLRYPGPAEGNVEVANDLADIPMSDQECANREQFHQ